MDASRGPALLAAGRLASLRLRVLPAGGAAVHRLHTQMSAPYYALVLLSLAGFALAIAAALSAWVTVTYGPTTASKGFFAQTYSSGGASVNTSVSPVGQPAAAGAMLLLGFISGFFHFLNTIHPRGAKAFFPNSQILFCVAALVFTFIGTVVGGGGPGAITAVVALGGPISYGPGFGCAIAATIIQAIAVGLQVVASRTPAPAPVLKSTSGTEPPAV